MLHDVRKITLTQTLYEREQVALVSYENKVCEAQALRDDRHFILLHRLHLNCGKSKYRGRILCDYRYGIRTCPKVLSISLVQVISVARTINWYYVPGKVCSVARSRWLSYPLLTYIAKVETFTYGTGTLQRYFTTYDLKLSVAAILPASPGITRRIISCLPQVVMTARLEYGLHQTRCLKNLLLASLQHLEVHLHLSSTPTISQRAPLQI